MNKWTKKDEISIHCHIGQLIDWSLRNVTLFKNYCFVPIPELFFTPDIIVAVKDKVHLKWKEEYHTAKKSTISIHLF